MDPDIPLPSIETGDLPDAPYYPSLPPMANTSRDALDVTAAATATPLPPSSPLKSPYGKTRPPSHSSSPHKTTRSPSSASSYSDRQTTPTLNTKRSSSNLNVHRATTPSRTQFRRTSSNLNPLSPVASFKSAMSSQEPPQPKILTPSLVAKDYFKRDLALHNDAQSRVAVIVHDSCYGHRFSRPRTSKSALASIVERPERIHATLLGASTAYVRLGGRHAQGRHPPHPEKEAPAHSVPFEIRKTSRSLPLNHPSVSHVHGSKWMEELQIMCDSAEGKLAMNGKELIRPIGYGKDENGNPLPKLHEGDLYLCVETLSALQGCLGGVCDAVDAVYGPSLTQRAFVCIRPPGHHCSSNVPSGFCWLNNVHVGITYGSIHHGLTHAAIIDFDLHHGDGSQAITWDHNRKAQTLPKNTAVHKKTPIGYYSIHDINSFPCEAGDEDKIRNASVCIENAHGQSIWNIHFEPWKNHTEFWKLYQTRYMLLLEKARKFLRHHAARLRQAGFQPKAAIFLSAGFDASEWEMPGMQRHDVNVPTEFYARFTADVVKMSQEEDLGVDGRVISVLEGGYSDRALTSGVLSHLCGLVDEPGVNVPINHTGGLAASVSAIQHGHGLPNGDQPALGSRNDGYSPVWWSIDELEVIEAIVLGNMPLPPKLDKEKPGSSYSSPTHSSTNRMTEVAKERRSLSTQLEARLSLENRPRPPPPDVDWGIAAYELSRLLIPSDRQTLSCRHDELNAEAIRVRKERQSTVGLPAAAGESMQLRERRPKPPPIPSSHVRSTSRSSTRRTTIASVNDLPDPSMSQAAAESANGRPRRRSSASSSILSSFQDMRLHDESEQKLPNPPNQAGASSRPVASSAASKPAKVPIARKPKAPAAAKPPAKPRSSPRKPKAISRPGSSSSDRTRLSRVLPDLLNDVSPPPPPPRTESANNDDTDDMDNITNGMKKVSIKLKMPSAEAQAAKERTAQAQPNLTTAPKTTQKAPAPRTVKPKQLPRPTPGSRIQFQAQAMQNPEPTPAPSATAEPSNDLGSQHVPPGPVATQTDSNAQLAKESIAQSAPSHPHQPEIVPAASFAQEASMAAAAETDAPTMPMPAPAFGSPSNDKENTKSEVGDVKPDNSKAGPTVPVASEQPPTAPDPGAPRPQSIGQIGARPLTPNKKTRDDLPRFTASSPIPFSKSSNQTSSAAVGQQQEMKQEVKSIWDIPETPHQQR